MRRPCGLHMIATLRSKPNSYRYQLGPYRNRHGHDENLPELAGGLWWPWWFRYGMKEASSVWQEGAMCFESMAAGADQLGGKTGGKAACLEAGCMCGLPS